MVGGTTSAFLSFLIFAAGLAAVAHGNGSLCSDASGVCPANAGLMSMINEHSTTDHLSYVQVKASKISQDPEKEFEKASKGAKKNHEAKFKGYTTAVPDEMHGTYKNSSEARQAREEEANEITASYESLTWAYEPKADGIKGPSQWGQTPGNEACAGDLQSPINVVWADAQIHPTLSVHDLEMTKESTDCDMTTEYLLNPRTTKRSYPGSCSRTFKVTWKEKAYYLSQFHYSSPSEHTYNGAYFPMEVHHVHKADDGQTLIIAVMVSALMNVDAKNYQDKVAADFMESFLDHVPHPTNQHKNHFSRMFASEAWDPYQDFLQGHLGMGFFHYVGSYTTPPCTADTIWMLDPVPIHVPISTIGKYRRLINDNPINQLARFESIFPEMGAVPVWSNHSGMYENGWNQQLKCNNRPLQPLDGRTVWAINASVPTLSTAAPMPGDVEFARATTFAPQPGNGQE